MPRISEHNSSQLIFSLMYVIITSPLQAVFTLISLLTLLSLTTCVGIFGVRSDYLLLKKYIDSISAKFLEIVWQIRVFFRLITLFTYSVLLIEILSNILLKRKKYSIVLSSENNIRAKMFRKIKINPCKYYSFMHTSVNIIRNIHVLYNVHLYKYQ